MGMEYQPMKDGEFANPLPIHRSPKHKKRLEAKKVHNRYHIFNNKMPKRLDQFMVEFDSFDDTGMPFFIKTYNYGERKGFWQPRHFYQVVKYRGNGKSFWQGTHKQNISKGNRLMSRIRAEWWDEAHNTMRKSEFMEFVVLQGDNMSDWWDTDWRNYMSAEQQRQMEAFHEMQEWYDLASEPLWYIGDEGDEVADLYKPVYSALFDMEIHLDEKSDIINHKEGTTLVFRPTIENALEIRWLKSLNDEANSYLE